jgi:hypothetical protein
MDVDDDPEGVEENELDNLDEEFVHPHLELEGDVDDAMQKVHFLLFCLVL